MSGYKGFKQAPLLIGRNLKIKYPAIGLLFILSFYFTWSATSRLEGSVFNSYCYYYHYDFVQVYHGLLVGCFGLNGPLRQHFSLYRAVSQREGERKEK